MELITKTLFVVTADKSAASCAKRKDVDLCFTFFRNEVIRKGSVNIPGSAGPTPGAGAIKGKPSRIRKIKVDFLV